MSLTVTSIVAAVLGGLVAATAFVAMMRRARGMHPWGDGADPSLHRAIRAHGNLVEYAPIFVILLGLLELRHAGTSAPIWLGAIFVAGRAAYVLYFFCWQVLPLRVVGFLSSVIPILVCAIWLGAA